MRQGDMEETKRRKKLTAGILAHVDAGKTTLSEALLFRAGMLRRLGRVDHRDTFLDTHALERDRGITIFSKQARIHTDKLELTLLDTPGHADLSGETERAIAAMDMAILVISGTDGVQAHTETLWSLLLRAKVPTFLFVTKMDASKLTRDELMKDIQSCLGDGCVAFPVADEEVLAVLDEGALEEFMETGQVSDQQITRLIRTRKLFPVCFGSGLRLEGIDEFLSLIERFGPEPVRPALFGARVYKIGRDPQAGRLTYMKLTGGALSVRDTLRYRGADGQVREEKAAQLRLYSGQKFEAVQTVTAGDVVAVTGLTETRPGMGLGAEPDGETPLLAPALGYRIGLPPGVDPRTVLPKLRQLEEEEPLLHIAWQPTLGEIQAQLMGPLQTDVLVALIRERFGLDVTVDAGRILYRETIAAPVEGVGHFEPLRHYAEVHLLLEPGAPGSGLVFGSAVSEDDLDLNWQRLILTHLAEKEHLGVLTGSPLTDVKITLIAGRAHLKHTEGGDFRQATYRAVRQGLMEAESVLLEPYYRFRLEVPFADVGRAISDIQAMGGVHEAPEEAGGRMVLTGTAPVSAMADYMVEVAAYTRGRGRAGQRVLRPRRRLHREVEPGEGVYASGYRVREGSPLLRPPAPAAAAESGHRRKGAGGHHGAGIRPRPLQPVYPASCDSHPFAPGGGSKGPDPSHRGRLQRDLRLGGAEGAGGAESGFGPVQAHRDPGQLSELHGFRGGAGVRRLSGARGHGRADHRGGPPRGVHPGE